MSDVTWCDVWPPEKCPAPLFWPGRLQVAWLCAILGSLKWLGQLGDVVE